jgi:hypothetical protein
MIRILLDFSRLNQVDLRNFAELIFSKMNNNPKYAMFQALIAILGTLTTSYKEALFAEDGSAEKRDAKKALNAELKEFLTKFAKKIEVVANDLPENERETFARGTGFNIPESGTTTKKAAVEFLEVPTSFKVADDERPFAALLTYDRMAGAKTYFAQELNKDGVWNDCGATAQLSLVVEGTESDVKRTFRIRCMNAEGVMSHYSKAVNVWVY